MKCSNCRVDNNLKDREANRGRCKNCRQLFAFEPTAMKAPFKFTDIFFAQLIEDVSANDTLFFTEAQLYYLINRRLERKIIQQSGPLTTLAFVGTVIGGIMLLNAAIGWGMVLIAISIVLALWDKRQKRKQLLKQPKTFPVNWATFNDWHQQWQRAKGDTQRQLAPVRQQVNQVAISPQVSDYSFDRVVVCEHDDIAQMLIANNLHFEHNCVVVSINGYPAEIFDTVMTMLKRNPNLSVYALHDASPSGLRVPTMLRQSQWFPDTSINIYDLGLLPRHAVMLKNPFVIASDAAKQQARQLPDEILSHLSQDEHQWLMAGNILALAAFGPKRILQVISQGIGRVRLANTATSGDDAYWHDSDDSLILFSDGFG
ncbi:MAG: hypothetical protein AAGD25_10310 [Cyanobacteria bacterium P01_F01_bin.150]